MQYVHITHCLWKDNLTVCTFVFNFAQIVADIYEPQGIEYVDAYGTFLSNELLPLVEKTVTGKKVGGY